MSSDENTGTPSQSSLDFGTGSAIRNNYRIVVYPFDKYEVTIKLSSDNKFLEILAIRINKDFRSSKQKAAQKIFRYIDESESE